MSEKSCKHEKKKRKRTIISADQSAMLETIFQQDHWPNRVRKDRLAKELNLPNTIIGVWYQNRRAKLKRHDDRHKQKSKQDKDTLKVRLPGLRTKTTHPKSSSSVEDGSEQEGEAASMSVSSASLSDSIGSIVWSENTDDSPENPDESLLTSPISLHSEEQHSGESESDTEQKTEDPTPQKQLKEEPDSIEEDIVTEPAEGEEDYHVPDVVAENVTIPSTEPPVSYVSSAQEQPQNQPLPGRSPLYRADFSSLQKPAPARRTSTSTTPTLFKALVNMVALAEGGIIDKTHPEFDSAVNDALYGIKVNQNARIIYDKDYGLDWVDME